MAGPFQPHDPQDYEDNNPLELAMSLLGMVEPPREPVVEGVNALTEAMRRTDAFFANADRASWDATLGVENRGYDSNLRQADNNRERGMPDILAETLGFVSEMGNPFPLDFVGDAVKAVGAAQTFGMIGPAALKRFYSLPNSNVQYINPNEIFAARGNELRRSPALQTAFGREIANDPDGMVEPVMLVVDSKTGRYKVGEGNHRTVAGMQEGYPVPATVVRGDVRYNEGLPAQLGERLIPDRFGYTPSVVRPSDIGLGTLNLDEVREVGIEAMRRNGVPQDEMDVALQLLDERYPSGARAVDMADVRGVQPQIPLNRFLQDSMASNPQQFIDDVFKSMGEERGFEYLASNTGLTRQEIETLLGR